MNAIEQEINKLLERLFPICRSITGDGVRESLKILQGYIPLEIKEVPTGTSVFDWKVPKEWNIKDAYIKDSTGKKIVDFKQNNLHVLGYSTPIKQKVSLKELKDHLHTLPDYPDWIPYLTSYCKENWGFCLTHKQLLSLKEDEYEVCIDSSLVPGALTYGELFIPGQSQDEVLFSTYLCHPSLANDNLSGPVLTTFLAQALIGTKPKYTYRFLFIPETIGAITWLSQNEDKLSRIKHGLVVTCVGDSGELTYKKSRDGEAIIDQIVQKVLADSGKPHRIIDFFPSGSDERQYCSPGINLPMGSLMRTPYGEFPEYHTSADNLDFIQPDKLADTLDKYLKVANVLENNDTYVNQNPKCEPQLGRRGLYNMIGGRKDSNSAVSELAIFWVLNMSDGQNSLLDIAIRSNLAFDSIKGAADALLECGLLRRKG